MWALDRLSAFRAAKVCPGFQGLTESSRTACVYNLLQKLPPTSVQNRFYLSVLEARHVHEHGAAERVTTSEWSTDS
jgi:hypothetical protein